MNNTHKIIYETIYDITDLGTWDASDIITYDATRDVTRDVTENITWDATDNNIKNDIRCVLMNINYGE